MPEKLNIQNLVDRMASKHDMRKWRAEAFIREVFNLIADALKEESYVKVKGLGTFKLIAVDGRESMNVNTKERCIIQGHIKVSFTPDNALRDLINKPFSQFETVILHEEAIIEELPTEEVEEEPVEEVKEEPVEDVKEEPVEDVKEELTKEVEEELAGEVEVPVDKIEEMPPSFMQRWMKKAINILKTMKVF